MKICENMRFTNQVKCLPCFWWSHLVPGAMVLSKSRRRLQRLERQKRSERRWRTRMTRGWLWHGYGSDGYHMDCDLWHVYRVYDVFVSMKESNLGGWMGHMIFFAQRLMFLLVLKFETMPWRPGVTACSRATDPKNSHSSRSSALGYIGIIIYYNVF